MIIPTSLSALQAGSVQLAPGDTLRVTVSFEYRVAEAITITLKVCPYTYTLGVLNRVDSCCIEQSVPLSQASAFTIKEVIVDVLMIPQAQGGMGDGTYGLIAEILGTDQEQHIDDCIIVSGNPEGLTDLIPMMMMLMMMGMVVNMMPKTE